MTSVRWYELRNPGGTPSVFQQGTLGASDGTHRWMGSIAMDKQGNIALGYSASSSSVNPSIHRLPPGSAPEHALLMVCGEIARKHLQYWIPGLQTQVLGCPWSCSCSLAVLSPWSMWIS